MKFRYRVKTKYEDIFYPELKKYKIIIQQYNPYLRLFKWDTKCDGYLEQFVYMLNPDNFEDIEYAWKLKLIKFIKSFRIINLWTRLL